MRLLISFAAFIATIVLFFGITTSTVSAQVTQQDINSSLCSGSNLDFSGNNSGCSTNGGTDINSLLRKIINLASLVVGFVAVIMIIVGGFRYITSGGSDTGVTGAKNTILYAIIGLIIVAVSQILVHFVLSNVSSSVTSGTLRLLR